MQRNIIVAIVISVAILVGYNFFMSRSTPPIDESPVTNLQPETPETLPGQVQPETREEYPLRPVATAGEVLTLENLEMIVQIDKQSGSITSIYLKKKKKELLDSQEQAISFLIEGPDGVSVPLDQVSVTVLEHEEQRLVLSWQDTDENINLFQSIELPKQGFSLQYGLEVNSPTASITYLLAPVKLLDERGDEELLVYWQDRLFEEKEQGIRSEYDNQLKWMGIREKNDYLLLMVPIGPISRGFLQGDYWGTSSSRPRTNWTLYAGPQSYPYMRLTNILVTETVGEDYHLTESLKISWWGQLAVGLSKLLIFLYGFTHNYGLAIVLLTLIIYGALSPLTFKQFESMRKMSLVQPEMKKLQAKYKKEPARLQKETMALYRKYKVNPMSGCLPMVVQLPIIFVLYRALLGFPFAESPSFLWISDLGTPNIPLLLGLAGAMFLQQRISQKLQVVSKEQEGMQKIMQFFPLFLILILWSLPSGVMLYWFTSTMISIVQQLFISRRPVSLPTPKET